MSKKPDLSIALIGAPHKEPDGGDQGDSHDDARDAMDAFIEAVHAKDVDGALQAWEALCDMYSAKDDDEDGEGDEGKGY